MRERERHATGYCKSDTATESRREISKITRAEIERKMIKLKQSS